MYKNNTFLTLLIIFSYKNLTQSIKFTFSVKNNFKNFMMFCERKKFKFIKSRSNSFQYCIFDIRENY